MHAVGAKPTHQLQRVAVVVGTPGLLVVLIAVLIGAPVVLFTLGSGGVVGARDSMSVGAVRSAGVPAGDVGVYRNAGANTGVPWQLLAALVDAQTRASAPDLEFLGPFRIRSGTAGVGTAVADSLTASSVFVARALRSELVNDGVQVSADMLTRSGSPGAVGGFDAEIAGARTDEVGRRADITVAALARLPVRNANQDFMTGVYDTAVRWALGQRDNGCASAATPVAAEPSSDGMPYALPATHGFTGAEEPDRRHGRVPSGKGNGIVTWPKHAALGQPYRDFYITMRWNYAAWNWDGTSTDIDQAQFSWFAEKPRLVMVTNPRIHATIIAAALEAGPGRHR